MIRRAGLASALFILLGCSDREPAAPAADAPSFQATPGKGATPRLLVTFADSEGTDFDAAVQALGGQVERRHSDISVVTLRGLSTRDAAVLANRPDVASVDSDMTLQWIPPPEQQLQQYATADTLPLPAEGADQSGAELFHYQWNMRVVDAADAWRSSPAGQDRLICILDTGVDPDHVELAGRVDLDRSISFVEGEPTIQDFNAHGTFVASIASGNGVRLASVASRSRICAVKVLGTNGRGTFGDLIAGILYAVDHGADVINMSLGAYVDLKEHGMQPLVNALQRAVDVAERHGVVIVAAAGNDTVNLDTDSRWRLEIPAQLDHVISVGATAPAFQQDFDHLATYSNSGGETGVSLVAPGGDLPVGGNGFDLVLGACSHTQVTLPWTCQTSYVLSGRGTSFAAPHVAGAAAVVASLPGHPSAAQVRQCLLESADTVGPTAIYGAGRVNVMHAAGCGAALGS